MGRNPVEDVYTEEECPFQMDRATWVRRGTDVTIVATGEMVRHAVDAADVLNGKVKVGNKVVMLGVGLVGSETALWLAENGHDVTLVAAARR